MSIDLATRLNLSIDLVTMLNLISATLAFVAAYWWRKAALVKTPKHMPAPAAMIDFNWLTEPLLAQAHYNKRGARSAAWAALLQGAAILVSMLRPT